MADTKLSALTALDTGLSSDDLALVLSNINAQKETFKTPVRNLLNGRLGIKQFRGGNYTDESGPYTPDAAVLAVIVIATGAGGGGGSGDCFDATANGAAGGGGAGETRIGAWSVADLQTPVTIAIGGGGSGAGSGGTGSAGGTTEFGDSGQYLSCPGGDGGAGVQSADYNLSNANAAGGDGADTGTGGVRLCAGEAGGPGYTGSDNSAEGTPWGGAGGASFWMKSGDRKEKPATDTGATQSPYDLDNAIAGYGGGGGGSSSLRETSALGGGAGGEGVITIIEIRGD